MKAPHTGKRKRVHFNLEAPDAKSVLIAGSFCDWELGAVELKRQRGGLWKTTIALEPGVHRYRFIVDGRWYDDPSCQRREANPFGSEDCIVEV